MPRKPSPLTPLETAAVADPVAYEVTVFNRGNNGLTKEFPLPELAQAQAHQKTVPRSILYVVGRNGIRVPHAQARG